MRKLWGFSLNWKIHAWAPTIANRVICWQQATTMRTGDIEIDMMKKILVLDDSPFMLTIVSDILAGLNYDVTTIDNGKDACHKVEAQRYDLIITDMNMPGMDGLEFTRKVRALPGCRFLPIVMLSSEEDHDRIAEAKKLGISTFISKPPKEAQLKSILQIILNKRSAPRIAVKMEVCFGDDETCGQTVNMSVNGMFLATDRPSPPGSKIKLKFSLPNSALPVSCQARVAWILTEEDAGKRNYPAGMGLEFLDLSDPAPLIAFLKALS